MDMSLKRLALLSSVVAFSVLGCRNENEPSEESGGTGGKIEGHGSGGKHNASGGDAGNANEMGGSASGGSAGHGGAADPGEAEGGSDETGRGGSTNGSSAGTGAGASTGSGAGRFFLPTSDSRNTRSPKVEVDGKGGIHAIYPAYAVGGAYYAYCARGCSGSEDVQVVSFDTEGTVLNAMLALDGEGRPRIALAVNQKVYFGSCDEDCGNQDNWQLAMILDHQGDREVTGEALALDPAGRPRLLLHTYRAFLGVGQKPPATDFASCDTECTDAKNWSFAQIADQIWENSQLKFAADGRAHLATVAQVTEGDLAGQKIVAYTSCASDCNQKDNWKGTGIVLAFEDSGAAFAIDSAAALALTRDGAPRIAGLARKADGARSLQYYECTGSDCSVGAAWHGAVISENSSIGAGLDLALDAQDHPRLAFTLGYNIGLYSCNAKDCLAEDVSWTLDKVEFASDLPKDSIILYPNCTVDAWFLHNPSLALTSEGKARIGYQASDVSGGWERPDPTKPDCAAGADMTLSRLAVMQ